jgi:Fe-S cluster assembly protein SufD
MNAEIRHMKTGAELALAETFVAAQPTLPGGGAVASLREQAFRRFEAKGLPHRRVEEWKYTDLRAMMRDAKPLAPPPDAAARMRAKAAGKLLAAVDCRRIVFVDGQFVAELSDLAGLEPGLTIRPLAEALAVGDAAVVEQLGRLAPEADMAVALNTALMGDGAVIRIAAGACIARPIHLLFAHTGDMPAAIFSRSLLAVEQGARVTVVESHEGVDGRDYQVNTALELAAADDSQVEHVKITAGAGLHVSTLMARVGARARFNAFAFTLDSAVVRNQLYVRFAGEGTQAGLRGATLLRKRQHADTTMVVEHAAVGCESREVFKAVLDDESRGVFQGKIIVQPHAQKTDGKMLIQGLLLSDEAEMYSKPELEIFADDVQCGHGATAGALDDDLLFYLESRGIPPKEAEALLVQAFVGEAVEAIEHEGIRAAVMDAAVAWLQMRAG